MEKTASRSNPFPISVCVPSADGMKLEQLEIMVCFLYAEEKIDYSQRDYWFYDEGVCFVKINNKDRLTYIEVMKKKIHNLDLSREEEQIIEDFEVITQAVTQQAVERVIREKLYVATLTEDEEKKERQIYRTRNKTEGTVKELPENLAVITNGEYTSGLSLQPVGRAYLYPLASTDGLLYQDGKLFFRGLPTSEATLKEINQNKDVEIESIDLPLLRMFYSIILMDFERSKQFGVVNESVTVYVPDLAAILGKSRNIGKRDITSIINKTSSFQTIYGVLKDPKRPNGIGSALPLLVWLGYDETKNTIKFSSPYMTELIKRIYDVSIRKDKKGLPKLKKNGEPLLEVSHSYLVKSSIVKEKNKRAAEIVMVVTSTIEQSGKRVAHLKVSTIVDRVPQLKDALDKAKTTSDKNRILKRSFGKAWELLETQTKLREKYPNIILPDPKNPMNIPTITALNTVFEFPK